MIVTDRALYLRKNQTGKLIFHLILVVGVHVYIFLILPGVNQRLALVLIA